MKMRTTVFAIITLTICMSAIQPAVESFKILVLPMNVGFNSRMLNMQKMADMLAQDGHQVDVLMNNKVKDHIIMKHANVINHVVPEEIKDAISMSMNEKQFGGLSFFKTIHEVIFMQKSYCLGIFENDALLEKIVNSDYDLLLSDMFYICNQIMTSYLNVPTIFYQNHGFFTEPDAFFPQFPSFTCHAAGTVCETDDMTFFERVLNGLFLVINNYFFYKPFTTNLQHQIVQETGIELKADLDTIMQNQIMLVNVDYVLESPRPTMPHVFTISGLFHKKPSPLASHFQAIVDKSGPHGIILMSFGTLVPKFDSKTAEIFAKVFGRLKQQVIWRYVGDKPKGLQNNTHLTEWFPQNDLLANTAVKLFITHCGISSTFESAYNGVPVIAMPLFGDQTTNAMKLVGRVKMGIKLDFFSITEEDFETGIKEVLSNPAYRENAMKASQTMSDQIVPPVQKFRHLVNFTIKTGGARHLFHPYAVRMSWFTFYGFDIMLFVLLVIALISSVLFLILRSIFRYFYRIVKTQSPIKKHQ